MKKKDENRFTIRFSPADPRQRMVRDALEASGRRKASLITDAVCEYLARYGDGEAIETFQLTPAYTLSASAIGNKPAENDMPLQPLEPGTVAEVITAESTNDIFESDPINDDIREAILGGLNAFNM